MSEKYEIHKLGFDPQQVSTSQFGFTGVGIFNITENKYIFKTYDLDEYIRMATKLGITNPGYALLLGKFVEEY